MLNNGEEMIGQARQQLGLTLISKLLVAKTTNRRDQVIDEYEGIPTMRNSLSEESSWKKPERSAPTT